MLKLRDLKKLITNETAYVKALFVIVITLLILMISLQIISINTLTIEQRSDGANYQALAKETAKTSFFYPSKEHIYSYYIPNPGYINFLALFYRVSSSDYLPLYGNVALTAILVFLVFYIAIKLFNNLVIGLLSALLFAIFPTNIALVSSMVSETFYCVFAYGAIALILTNLKYKYAISGALLGFANFTRPLALAFFVAIILHMLIAKQAIRHYVEITLGMLAIVIIIGSISFFNMGYFVFQSTVGGANMILSANDDAKGNFESGKAAYKKGNIGYIENEQSMTFKEKDRFLRQQAINWIKENPLRYISMFPTKMFYMYSIDTYAFAPLYNNTEVTAGRPYVSKLVGKLLSLNFSELSWQDVVVTYNQCLYMLILVLSVISSYRFAFKKKELNKVLMLSVITVAGTGITLLASVGGARYHYPYLPVFFIFSAALINDVIMKTKLLRLK